jgi:hypothetical protein
VHLLHREDLRVRADLAAAALRVAAEVLQRIVVGRQEGSHLGLMARTHEVGMVLLRQGAELGLHVADGGGRGELQQG